MHSAGEGPGKAVIAWKGYGVVINGMQLLWFFTSSKKKELIQKRKKRRLQRICYLLYFPV